MNLILKRFAYFHDCTRGVLQVGEDYFETVERPWIRNPDGKGGVPFKSCVPDGAYILRPYTRASGKQAFIFSNPELGVWETQAEKGSKIGRYATLIHVGNTTADVVGCIAPGMRGSDHAVEQSRTAMNMLLQLLTDNEYTLEISPKGASDSLQREELRY